MTKKKGKVAARKTPSTTSEATAPAKPQEWGYEEMLTELEAIVSDAELRLESEDI